VAKQEMKYLENDSDVVCIDCHCEVVIQVLGSVPPCGEEVEEDKLLDIFQA